MDTEAGRGMDTEGVRGTDAKGVRGARPRECTQALKSKTGCPLVHADGGRGTRPRECIKKACGSHRRPLLRGVFYGCHTLALG